MKLANTLVPAPGERENTRGIARSIPVPVSVTEPHGDADNRSQADGDERGALLAGKFSNHGSWVRGCKTRGRSRSLGHGVCRRFERDRRSDGVLRVIRRWLPAARIERKCVDRISVAVAVGVE
jgi:hypothetical protein